MPVQGQLQGKAERTAIEANAARLVVLLDGCGDPAIRREADRWIEADPYHAVAFAAADAAWQACGRTRLRGPANDMAAERMPHVSRRRLVAGLGALAAGAVGAVGLGSYLKLFGDRHSTGRGERALTQLADGSSISLNAETMLDVELGRHRRLVRMPRGEALFTVARDEARPFIVDLDGAQIRVLGTRFNVRRRGDVIQLAVTEGRVAVSLRGAPGSTVAAGASAIIRPGVAVETSEEPELIRQRLAWTEGFLQFDGEPLREVVEEFNRYRTSPLVIGDPRIGSTIVAGRFGIDQSDEFVDALQSSFGIDAARREDGGIVLTRRGTPASRT